MVKFMNKLKKGYSLFEACVVMLIVAVFVALVANVIPHKVKSKVQSEAHGRFECYYENGTLYQQMFTENSTTGRKKAVDDGGTATECSFHPPYYAKYMIIDAVGGGAGGSDDGGGSEGQFTSTFYASVHTRYLIKPGRGGEKNNHGGDTIVKGDGFDLLKAKGGKSIASLDNTTVNDILGCVITEYAEDPLFDCKIYPTCEVKDGKIKVSFCRTKTLYKTSSLTYKQVDDAGDTVWGNPRHIVHNIPGRHYNTLQKEGSPNVWVYHDISLFSDYDTQSEDPIYIYDWVPSVNDKWTPSLYTMELVMDMPMNGDGESPSNLSRYIESMQYTSKIKDAKAGTGGAKNQKGYDGAALLLW